MLSAFITSSMWPMEPEWQPLALTPLPRSWLLKNKNLAERCEAPPSSGHSPPNCGTFSTTEKQLVEVQHLFHVGVGGLEGVHFLSLLMLKLAPRIYRNLIPLVQAARSKNHVTIVWGTGLTQTRLMSCRAMVCASFVFVSQLSWRGVRMGRENKIKPPKSAFAFHSHFHGERRGSSFLWKL